VNDEGSTRISRFKPLLWGVLLPTAVGALYTVHLALIPDARTFTLIAALFALVAALLFLWLREREKTNSSFSVVARALDICCWEWDLETDRIRLTLDTRLLFGKEVETFEDFLSLLHPDDAFSFRKKVDAFRAGSASPLAVEFRVQSARGRWRWFAFKSSFVEPGALGGPAQAKGGLWDIDDYRQATEAVRQSESRIASIFKTVTSGIAVTDREGRLLEANRAFYDMLGYSAEELQGRPLLSLAEDPRGRAGGAGMEEAAALCASREDKQFRLKENFVRRDGKRVAVNYGVSSIIDFDGNIVSYIFSGVDVTAQEQHAARLELLTERQRWLFGFLRQFNQCEDIERLFDALKENLHRVVSFSTLKLLVPSYLGVSWVMDGARGRVFGEDERTALQALRDADTPEGQAWTGAAALREAPESAGFLLAVPLSYKDWVWGAMVLEKEEGSEPFDASDAALMGIVGSNVAVYLKDRSDKAERDLHTRRLQQLHELIHTLLQARDRDRLVKEMLGYLRAIIPASACAVYLVSSEDGGRKLERLDQYGEEGIFLPDGERVMASAVSGISLVDRDSEGAETRRISPIVFQKRGAGAVDLYKPSGLSSSESELYQLLTDYVSGLWVLYDLVALREREASVDPLTGIWNRRYMLQRLEEESVRIRRYGGNVCLAISDLGNFKNVNDSYGHAKGDDVLSKAAATIKKDLRVSDSLGRYGGDEFIIVLPNVSRESANTVIERVKDAIHCLRILSDDSDPGSPRISIDLDVGTAIFPDDASSIGETIVLADERMYRNKVERKKRLGLSLQREEGQSEATG
jgi:diguanylate cyclase (GGDEF)-like protein/PAS domain S-box-containing protein